MTDPTEQCPAPLFSIIIPHHNIPRLLQRCLDSIPHRPDLEIVVVDDNSDPKVVDFSHFPGQDDPRVHLIFDKVGGGAGHARNVALDAARGRWIICADADDFFLPSFNSLLNKYAHSDFDVVYFNAISLDSDTYAVSHRTRHVNQWHTLAARNPQAAEAHFRHEFGEPWAKIISAQLLTLNHIRCAPIPIHDDTQFGYLIGYHARTVALEPTAAYCLTTRSGSVSQGVGREKEMVRIDVFCQKQRFARDHNLPFYDLFHYDQLASFLLHLRFADFRAGLQIARCHGVCNIPFILRIIWRAVVIVLRKIKKVVFG
ncbi:MAG: glycosyltransferase family 2 protein [Marinilabiliaceae bacterium]|nr:glycosyltransferase family 2 protein [Bacteroidales bacterium]